MAVRPLLPDVTAPEVERLLQVGYRIRVTPGHRPFPRWMTVATVDENGQPGFNGDADTAADTDLLIQFGPASWMADQVGPLTESRPPSDERSPGRAT